MKNRPNNRRNSREELDNRWEWVQNNPNPASLPEENEGKRNTGQPSQTPPAEGPGIFGFLGWGETPPQSHEGQQNPRNAPAREGDRGRGESLSYEYYPDAWLDEPLPWELPPEGEQRRRTPPWEQARPRADISPYRRTEPQQPRTEFQQPRTEPQQPRQETEWNDRREAGKSNPDRGWEDLPSLYDELETVESPRARVKGRRSRRLGARRRRRNR
ncbi:hypothetical protein [Desmospora activa]|uniref:Uncharacterized protein n=1 Tax=Desmospora activa DSM 45169 TaxID=1121389 RepID=A0A2T4ZB39_9BACL|nr:hypothetical protein [Desmospora activa]PTM59114.1 hypothetical protein C8J48_1716 [Desmospora activa DSM 45169]